MHPQIKEPKPGICEICGMDLESHGAPEEEEKRELNKMVRRFIVGILLTIPILVFIAFPQFGFIQAILATLLLLYSGWFIFYRGLKSIRKLKLNMFTLIALGIGVAYFYSLALLIFPTFFRQNSGSLELYFDSAALITLLIILGQILELRARSKTGSAIKELLHLSPKQAMLVLEDGSEKIIELQEVKQGDILRVKPGEKVPVDGKVIEGTTAIDESMITGESVPSEKTKGDKVSGATLNGSGSFLMQAEKVGSETLLARIIQMVSSAQSSHAPVQKLVDTVASYFVPAVVVVAIITFFAWFFLAPSLPLAITASVSVLIIACPCALGLATPMSIMVGVGKGAKEGILIKNAEALELMAKINTIACDKTGTLTEGKIQLNEIFSPQTEDKMPILQLGASLEALSEHPLSHAIVLKAKEKELKLLKVENFLAVTGKGVKGTIEGKQIIVGNQKMMQEEGVSLNLLSEQAQKYRHEGQTILYFAIDQVGAALFAVSDVIKPSTPDAIEMLHKEHIKLVMLTGDHQITAEAIGKKLNIDHIEAEVLPEDKNRIVKQLQSQGDKVAMAGDGINDAPALAAADVGIAMGTGTDVAMESASLTLIKGDLRGIASARRLSLATTRNIRQNLLFAFIYNTIGIPIAAGIFYPIFGLLLSPIIASAAMAFSSVSVMWNALRLRGVQL